MQVKRGAVSEASEPLLATLDSVSIVKQYINYDENSNDDIALYKKMAVAVRELCEQYTGMAFAEQEIVVYVTHEYLKRRGYRFSLPFCPISGDPTVVSVNYEGTETAQTKNSNYYLIGNLFKKIDIAKITGTFVTGQYNYDYKITYTAGYGITGDNATATLPQPLLFDMLKILARWWDKRADFDPVLTRAERMSLYAYRKTSII